MEFPRRILILAESTWKEVSEYIESNTIAILPIGANEQHGLHLPLNTDIFCAEQFARRAISKISGRKIILLPPLPYGFSPTHMAFPGTITFSAETFMNVVKDICRSMIRHGVKKIVLLNGHAGNSASLGVVATEIRVETGAAILVVNWWDLCTDAIKSNFGFMFHACEAESSVAMALGQRVQSEKARGIKPSSDIEFVRYNMVEGGSRVTASIKIINELSETGSIGSPEKMDLKKGEEVVRVALERFAKLLSEFYESG